MRVAAIGDLHVRRHNLDLLARRLDSVAREADLLCVTGDLTDDGDPEDARRLGALLGGLGLPCVAVLGNHDHDRGEVPAVRQALAQAGVTVLDGSVARVGDLGLTGVKGFGGGFGRRRVGGFGEPMMKQFVQEADLETERLAAALASLKAPRRVVLLHYAPVHDTLVGESPEIYPFLGNSDLGEVIDAARADLVLHGHAHFGRHEGRTPGGIPVFNVAIPVLDRLKRRWARIDLNGAAATTPPRGREAPREAGDAPTGPPEKRP
jgi:Icc-related predicted phosphoesterase